MEPNQKIIYIKNFSSITHKEKTREQFLQPIDWKYYLQAMHDLGGNAFKVWVYILKWVGQGYYEFSPANICRDCNIKSRTTIYAIINEFIEKGYAIENVAASRIDFYPCGHANLIADAIKIE